MEKKEFINLIEEGAIKGWLEYKVLPSLTMAQAILESGWGKSHIGNNLFGIKANSAWKGTKKAVPTFEYYNGKKVRVIAEFRTYPSFNDSILDHAVFLNVNPRYKKVLGEKNYVYACDAIKAAGYATDPIYSKSLQNIIVSNNLTQYDKKAFAQESGNKPIVVPTVDPHAPSNWAIPSWEWAKANKITDGTNPKSNITREEAAKMIYSLVHKG